MSTTSTFPPCACSRCVCVDTRCSQIFRVLVSPTLQEIVSDNCQTWRARERGEVCSDLDSKSLPIDMLPGSQNRILKAHTLGRTRCILRKKRTCRKILAISIRQPICCPQLFDVEYVGVFCVWACLLQAGIRGARRSPLARSGENSVESAAPCSRNEADKQAKKRGGKVAIERKVDNAASAGMKHPQCPVLERNTREAGRRPSETLAK